MSSNTAESAEVQSCHAAPRVSRWVVNAFAAYLHRYFRRQFHSVCISFETELTVTRDMPLVVYANHASWWDPLFGLVMQRHIFPEHTLFAPMDAAALKRYRILKKLGFFGVEQDDSRGAASFLRASRGILSQSGTSIWLTPEGRFADPRDHGPRFQPGLAHLVSRLQDGIVLPLAVEYPFWEERLPEALARFGEPFVLNEQTVRSKEQWNVVLQERLRQTQCKLAELSMQRRSDAFQVLISGRAGIGLVYDTHRRMRSWLLGERFQAEHGARLK